MMVSAKSVTDIRARGLLFVGDIGGLDLLNQEVDFVRREFFGELRHPPLSVGDHIAQVVNRCPRDLIRDERRTTEMASGGGFSVTARAIFLVYGIVGETRGGAFRLSLRNQSAREERGSESDRE
jgi:hypothetical protein